MAVEDTIRNQNQRAAATGVTEDIMDFSTMIWKRVFNALPSRFKGGR